MNESMVWDMLGQPGGWLSMSSPGGSQSVVPTASAGAYGTVGGAFQVGQISLSLLFIGVLGVMGFYLWTRGVQK